MTKDKKPGGKPRRRTRKAPEKSNGGTSEPPQLNTEDESGRNEYGGLPNRDLKKNLGCG